MPKDKEYTVKDEERDMKQIFDALHKKDTAGKKKFDMLITDMDTCPFCGTEGKTLPDGTKEKQLVIDRDPVTGDSKTLTWHTKNCCNAYGAPINYVMWTRKLNKEKAISWLKEFVR